MQSSDLKGLINLVKNMKVDTVRNKRIVGECFDTNNRRFVQGVILDPSVFKNKFIIKYIGNEIIVSDRCGRIMLKAMYNETIKSWYILRNTEKIAMSESVLLAHKLRILLVSE